MTLDFLDNRRFRQVFTLIMVAGAMACIFPSESYTMKWWSGHAEHISVNYLMLGLLFLFINKNRLMFVCFGCSAAINFFIFETNDNNIKDTAPTNMPFVRVAQFNVTNGGAQVEDLLNSILSRDADVISLQEITPDWEQYLVNTIGKRYPYYVTLPSISNGISLFSRFPFVKCDTFYYKDLPNLAVKIVPESSMKPICIISSAPRPPLSGSAIEELKKHLQLVSYYALECDAPVVTVGNYNAVSWSKEITDFRNATGLKDSRRGIKPSEPDGKFPLFNVPIEHIFYSKEYFDCIKFETISNPNSDFIGIESTLQLKKDLQNEHKEKSR